MSDLSVVSELQKERCTGCGACVGACPAGCIRMTADKEGFLYPEIEKERCTACGICAKTCPVIHRYDLTEETSANAYAAWSLDEETRYTSTSGGIFTELAKAIILQNGAVAGARYDWRNKICHVLVDHEADLPLLRQSKYAQSDMGNIYREINSVLDVGRYVLFVGTPCQCAAVARRCGHGEKLILCDFICRGVNSPYIFSQYLEELEVRYGSKVKRVWFKNKERSWNAFGTRIDFENGQTYFGGREDDPFMYGYIHKGLNLYMRPSCGQCEFKGVKRPTDITLGDFWGVKLRESEDDMHNGVSAVIVHTEAGQRLLNIIAPNIYCEEQNIEAILPFNTCLTEPAKRDAERSKRFFSLVETLPFSEAIKYIDSKFISKNHGG